MRGARRQRREDAEALAGAIADVQRARRCADCGRVFLGSSAFTVHRDGGRCLPGDAHGQLEDRGGVWARPGDPAAS